MEAFGSAMGVSLTCSLTATVICACIGIPLGFAIALNDFAGKGMLLSVLQSLLAVPTVVVGLFVYALIRRNGILGDLGLLYTVGAIILGQAVLALPIMMVFTHAAVNAVDKAALETARTLGANPLGTIRVLSNEARFGIFAAVAATFGRLIGEVGVSMMLGGNILDSTRTMTTAIALETSKGEFTLGLQLGVALLAFALGVNIVIRLLQGRGNR